MARPNKIDKQTIHATLIAAVAHGQPDRVTAEQLGVGDTTVWNWRHKYGIPPADKFVRTFAQRHGTSALPALLRALDERASYARLGRAFGVSRERVRQWVGELRRRGLVPRQDEGKAHHA